MAPTYLSAPSYAPAEVRFDFPDIPVLEKGGGRGGGSQRVKCSDTARSLVHCFHFCYSRETGCLGDPSWHSILMRDLHCKHGHLMGQDIRVQKQGMV